MRRMKGSLKMKGLAKEPPFNEEIDGIIVERMKELGHLNNPCALISKEIPKYNAKRIYRRWRNNLDPRLWTGPLGKQVESYIIQWVKGNQAPKIPWSRLVVEIEENFGKKYSENRVKNFWYSEGRRMKGKQEEENIDDKHENNEPSLSKYFMPPPPPQGETNLYIDSKHENREPSFSRSRSFMPPPSQSLFIPLPPSFPSKMHALCLAADYMYKRDFVRPRFQAL